MILVLQNCEYMLYIDQTWGQGGWILVKFFFVFLWTGTKSRSIETQKKNETNIHSSWPWSIKDLFYGRKVRPNKFRFCGNKAGDPEWQDRPISPSWVAIQVVSFDTIIVFFVVVVFFAGR